VLAARMGTLACSVLNALPGGAAACAAEGGDRAGGYSGVNQMRCTGRWECLAADGEREPYHGRQRTLGTFATVRVCRPNPAAAVPLVTTPNSRSTGRSTRWGTDVPGRGDRLAV
jgi:hypothetical protein